MSTETVEQAWCVVVPHHPRGAQLARHRIADDLSELLPAASLGDVVAVLAELVGNSVRHARALPGGVIRVACQIRSADEARTVQVRVTDGGADAPPQVRVSDLEAIDGRGLHIVAALASRWGHETDGLGQTVWAEFAAGSAIRGAATPDQEPAT